MHSSIAVGRKSTILIKIQCSVLILCSCLSAAFGQGLWLNFSSRILLSAKNVLCNHKSPGESPGAMIFFVFYLALKAKWIISKNNFDWPDFLLLSLTAPSLLDIISQNINSLLLIQLSENANRILIKHIFTCESFLMYFRKENEPIKFCSW